MLKRILLLLLAGVFSYLCFLVATLPAGIAWSQVAPKLPLKRLNIDVKAVSGTVWKGEALAVARGVEVILSWDINMLGVVSGRLPVDLIVKSALGQLETTVSISPGGAELDDTKGKITLSKLNPLLKRQKLTLSGEATVEKLSLGYSDGVITVADGLVKWTGGVVKYPAGREIHGGEFPPFSAILNKRDDDVALTVRDAQSATDSIEAVVSATGVATVKVKRRLLDLANEPWPKNSSENDVVFKMRRKIL